MVNIAAVDNFQPGELQLNSLINTLDNSQHGAVALLAAANQEETE